MEVEVGVQVLLIEFIDQRCPTLRNMLITETFSYHGSIVAFRQRVIVAMP